MLQPTGTLKPSPTLFSPPTAGRHEAEIPSAEVGQRDVDGISFALAFG